MHIYTTEFRPYKYFKSKRRRQRKSVLCDVFDIVMKQSLEYLKTILKISYTKWFWIEHNIINMQNWRVFHYITKV